MADFQETRRAEEQPRSLLSSSFSKAGRTLRDAISSLGRFFDQLGREPGREGEVMTAAAELCETLLREGAYEEVEDLASRVGAMVKGHPKLEGKFAHMQVLNTQTTARYRMGEAEAALESADYACRLAKRLYASGPEAQKLYGVSLVNRGRVRHALGQFPAALDDLAAWLRLPAWNSKTYLNWRHSVLVLAASCSRELGDRSDTRHWLRELSALVEGDRNLSSQTAVLNQLSEFSDWCGQPKRAFEYARRAYEASPPCIEVGFEQLSASINWAKQLNARRKGREAERVMLEAMGRIDFSDDGHQGAIVGLFFEYSRAFQVQGNFKEARHILRLGEGVCAEAFGEPSAEESLLRGQRAALWLEQDEDPEKVAHLAKGAAAVLQREERYPEALAEIYAVLSSAYRRMGNYEAAEEALLSSLERCAGNPRGRPEFMANVQYSLGTLLLERAEKGPAGDDDVVKLRSRSLQELDRACGILQECRPVSELHAKALRAKANLLDQQKEFEKAVAAESLAKEIEQRLTAKREKGGKGGE